MPVAPFRCLELFLVHTKLERFPRYLMAFGGYLQLHELEGAARCQQNPRGTFTFTGAATQGNSNGVAVGGTFGNLFMTPTLPTIGESVPSSP